MKTLRVPDFDRLVEQLRLYARVAHEEGARGVAPALREAEKALKQALREIQTLPPDPALAAREPDDLETIRDLRPDGPRRLRETVDADRYADRLAGAFLGRCAGCTLGAPVELWPVEKMKTWAEEIGDPFPPTDYWSAVPEPHQVRYGMSRTDAYTRGTMRGIPVDDDIVYTLLGLLVLEKHGPDFTVDDVGALWAKVLPMACTAERVALEHMQAGGKAAKAGEKDNPYRQWIGAGIRADPWGYVAPGWPERAAAMAYRDAFLSHRRNGIYGAMLFAAAVSAAFVVEDPLEAIRIGLTEIPRRSSLAEAVVWALEEAGQVRDYRHARALVDGRFPGMHDVHILNNACLTVFGLALGGRDVTRVLSETVAMGLDNDCTTATAGSIVGAVVGRAGIPEHWTRPFGDTVHAYLKGYRTFGLEDVLARFERQARKVFGE